MTDGSWLATAEGRKDGPANPNEQMKQLLWYCEQLNFGHPIAAYFIDTELDVPVFSVTGDNVTKVELTPMPDIGESLSRFHEEIKRATIGETGAAHD